MNSKTTVEEKHIREQTILLRALISIYEVVQGIPRKKSDPLHGILNRICEIAAHAVKKVTDEEIQNCTLEAVTKGIK